MIQLHKVRKAFKGKPALHELSLEIPKGEIFGLLGHNGAGKSTTFGILLGQVYPDGGEAFIAGVSVQRERARALSRVGAIFEAPAFYGYMSGWKNLEIFASYSGVTSRRELLDAVETVGLSDRIHDEVRTYSHGMRQRLGLAQALVPAPELVLLDEPTEGLDPEGIHEMRNLILKLNKERGLTVLLSSHLLAEVEQLCDRVAILNKGHLVYQGRWVELAGRGNRYRFEVDDPSGFAALLTAETRLLSPNTVEMESGTDVADLVAKLVNAGIRVRAVEPLRPNLESLYLDAIAHRGESPTLIPTAATAAVEVAP